jgi:hypothetical protein
LTTTAANPARHPVRVAGRRPGARGHEKRPVPGPPEAEGLRLRGAEPAPADLAGGVLAGAALARAVPGRRRRHLPTAAGGLRTAPSSASKPTRPAPRWADTGEQR